MKITAALALIALVLPGAALAQQAIPMPGMT